MRKNVQLQEEGESNMNRKILFSILIYIYRKRIMKIGLKWRYDIERDKSLEDLAANNNQIE